MRELPIILLELYYTLHVCLVHQHYTFGTATSALCLLFVFDYFWDYLVCNVRVASQSVVRERRMRLLMLQSAKRAG